MRSEVLMVMAAALFVMAGSFSAAAAPEDIADSEIVKAVESDLLVSRTVSAHLIDVECDEGIVTLRGSADNLLARDQAVRIARSFRGVRSVVDLIEIRPVLVSDGQLLENVRTALATDPATELYELNVEVKDGTVILKGTVDSMAEKELAGSVVKSVAGVREVENDINIYFAKKRPDGEIKQEIEKILEYNPYLYPGLIEVEVDGGRVSLSGAVGSSADKVRAYSDSWVAGVSMVDASGLEVKWWLGNKLKRDIRSTDISDEAVERAIERSFASDPRVLSFEIDIVVRKGVATLRGTVDNLKAKRAARRDAENTLGVAWVDDFIKVRPEIVPDDEELRRRVEIAVLLDPVLMERDITILTRNGKVYLYGYADSFYEKFHADDVVSRVRGVVDVQNNISVNYPALYVTDGKIEREIRRKYLWSFVIDAEDIEVSVDGGVARLSGTVDDWREYKAAIDKAFEGGARSVENDLQIAGQPDTPFPYPYYNEHINIESF